MQLHGYGLWDDDRPTSLIFEEILTVIKADCNNNDAFFLLPFWSDFFLVTVYKITC